MLECLSSSGPKQCRNFLYKVFMQSRSRWVFEHVAALLYTLMDYVNIDAEVVPADLTCTQISQKWHIPTSANMTLKKAVKFNYLIFEKSEENKKRKRPVVSGVRENFCATPSFAHTLLPEELHTLVRNLSACNSSALFCRAVESNNFQPCTIFDKSCSRNIREKIVWKL